MQSDNTIEHEANKLRLSDEDLVAETLAHHPTPVEETVKDSTTRPYRFVPLTMGGRGRTHIISEGSKSLTDEVALEDLTHMTELFYEKAFLDQTLDRFIRSHGDPHGTRFAKWIHQKLSGSSVWDQDRQKRSKIPVTVAHGHQAVVHDRSSAHAAAWYSPKRPDAELLSARRMPCLDAFALLGVA